MIALTKENQDTDVCSFVVNRENELTTLTHTFNGNKIGHGSDCLCLENKSVYIYDEESHTWIQLA